jgi:hypothetical protein
MAKAESKASTEISRRKRIARDLAYLRRALRGSTQRSNSRGVLLSDIFPYRALTDDERERWDWATEAEREWITLDLLYLGGWLHDDRARTSPRGAPRQPETEFWNKRIAAYVTLLECEGWRTEPAIAKARQIFRVTRSAAFAARKRWAAQLASLGYDRASPELRQRRIKVIESLCADPLIQSK